MTEPRTQPYDLSALDPDELEALLLKRPDLRKEIMAEANSRMAPCPGCLQVGDCECTPEMI